MKGETGERDRERGREREREISVRNINQSIIYSFDIEKNIPSIRTYLWGRVLFSSVMLSFLAIEGRSNKVLCLFRDQGGKQHCEDNNAI